MSITFPNTILAHHASRPFVTARSLENAPCLVLTESMRAFRDKKLPDAKPEQEALAFYMLNQAVGVLGQKRDPLEPLTEAELGLVKLYHQRGTQVGLRALFYLLVITSRESRHLKNKSQIKPAVAEQFGQKAADYLGTIKDSAHEAHEAIEALIAKPPACTVGQYVGAMRYAFYNGAWSSGYGGDAWGQVTDCLLEFVLGHTSLDMMTDTVWTLCHNNGPIFNKGVLYHHHTDELLTILDVQNSGQTVGYVLEPGYKKDAGNPAIAKQIAKQIAEVMPELAGYVDWFKVKALGAKKGYAAEMAHQAQVHGPSEWASKIPANPNFVKPKPKAPPNSLTLWPGMSIPIIKLKRAA